MNPLTGLTQILGVGMGLISMGSGLVSQAVGIHQQLSPPQAQAQAAQQCLPPTMPMVEVRTEADGTTTRRVVCVEQRMVQP